MFSKEILKKAEKRENRSQEYEKRYRSGAESALREFCKIDPFAIKTPWVQKAIESCLMSGNMAPLKNLFTTGKREKKSPITERTHNLLIKKAVDYTVEKTGLPKKQPEDYADNTAYDSVYNNQVLTFEPAIEMSPKTILNHCSQLNSQSLDIMIEKIMGGVILRCGPTVFTMEGKPIIGIFEIMFPADGGEPFINANGVFNTPFGKDKYDILPESWKQVSKK